MLIIYIVTLSDGSTPSRAHAAPPFGAGSGIAALISAGTQIGSIWRDPMVPVSGARREKSSTTSR
jgi:hypothetical protein